MKTPPSAEPRRILVVDDHPDALESLAALLAAFGHDVRCAPDGREALNVAESFLPEYVLLDIGMPKLDGYQTARLARQRDWGLTVVLVAITGWGQEEDKRRAEEAGFDFHMTKPVDPAALCELLARSPDDSSRRRM